MRTIAFAAAALAGLLAVDGASPAAAETDQLRAARQYGLSTLPLMIMEDQKLIEKHAAAEGLEGLTVEWVQLGGPGAMTEALISGDLDFGAGGVPSMLTLWDRTKDTPMEVKGVGNVVNMPMELVTTNPNVKSIEDFTEDDKIAVTTIKVSNQAMLLQMAAAQAFGEDEYDRLDHLTVSLPHPEAMSTLASNTGVISAHFSALPYQYRQKKQPGVHLVLSSYDVLGGPASNTVAFTTKRFHDDNPKAYAAYAGALQEAIDIINADKKAAAEAYKRMSNTDQPIEELVEILDDPQVQMTFAPQQTMKMASFMAEIGRLDNTPEAWTDLFFDNMQGQGGS
ncbi:ABC transporter substrate-binding protein [Marinivivus vitaminiproducens]|uniref:ABC transporter substrate-binding protein n=1 Tax=Marinivivus vitaminiproducens TaxID=3035935 RepID=UPI002797F22F|nr:ABC transporter substrate-binding protein [Geminicoccaceae bacterium SCSIO 64248]